MLRVSVVLLSVLCVVYAAPPLGGEPKPLQFSHKQTGIIKGCLVEDLEKEILFGQSAPARSKCEEYRCHEDLSVTVKSCPSEYALPPYELFEDKTKPYPDCCPYYKIPE